MKAAAWAKKIKQACEEAGTYRPYFQTVINMLADIMEQRDDAMQKYEATGKNTVVAHTNKGGATNIVKNPALVVIMDLNAQALSYWRDLGLTPSGLKKINERALEQKKGKGLADMVAEMLGE